MKRLEHLESEHPDLITPESPTQRVGGQPLEQFATVEHSVPMLSIDNTYSFDEVREWDQRVRRGLNAGDPVRYVVELKVDGVAVSLRYERGRFVQGAGGVFALVGAAYIAIKGFPASRAATRNSSIDTPSRAAPLTTSIGE